MPQPSMLLVPTDRATLEKLLDRAQKGDTTTLPAAGAELWPLPPYSHDLNPIEQMGSKVKAHLRRVKARDTQGLIAAIGDALKTITPEDAVAWFAHCGYPNTQT